MGLKNKYKVQSIKKELTYEWLAYKHYAKKIPIIAYAFGLYNSWDILQGVCTFGYGNVPHINNGSFCLKTLSIDTLELNRLCMNEGHERNLTSWFVSKVLRQLDKPKLILSYADANQGHNGYIYQSLNFLYIGMSIDGGKNNKYYLHGKEIHGRNLKNILYQHYKTHRKDNNNAFIEMGGTIEKLGLKHRYLYFLCSKKDKEKYIKDLKYKILPYPKGQNKRYDASFETSNQYDLFI